MEQLKKLLEVLSNDYEMRNEYGMSYDNYYHVYDAEENIPIIAQDLLDNWDELFVVEARKRKLEKL